MSAVTPSAADQGSAPGVGAGGTGAGGPEAPLPAERGEDRWGQLVQNIARGNLLVVVASFVFAFIIGSILILIADEEVREAAGYFFARPSDTLSAAWQSISQAYLAMFRGAVFDVPAFTRTLDTRVERGFPRPVTARKRRGIKWPRVTLPALGVAASVLLSGWCRWFALGL